MTHSVFIIDDDPAVRDSLLALFRGEGMRARAFPDGRDFLDQLPEDKCACVVTDIRMPQVDGAELVDHLQHRRGINWPVIVITGHADVPLAVQLMKAGVVDFIEKPFDPSRLLESVRGCIASLAAIAPEIVARERAQHNLDILTRRERQVFDALIQGKSNKEMAVDLAISHRTVEIFRANVMQKMGADSLSALIRMGLLIEQA